MSLIRAFVLKAAWLRDEGEDSFVFGLRVRLKFESGLEIGDIEGDGEEAVTRIGMRGSGLLFLLRLLLLLVPVDDERRETSRL